MGFDIVCSYSQKRHPYLVGIKKRKREEKGGSWVGHQKSRRFFIGERPFHNGMNRKPLTPLAKTALRTSGGAEYHKRCMAYTLCLGGNINFCLG